MASTEKSIENEIKTYLETRRLQGGSRSFSINNFKAEQQCKDCPTSSPLFKVVL